MYCEHCLRLFWHSLFAFCHLTCKILRNGNWRGATPSAPYLINGLIVSCSVCLLDAHLLHSAHLYAMSCALNKDENKKNRIYFSQFPVKHPKSLWNMKKIYASGLLLTLWQQFYFIFFLRIRTWTHAKVTTDVSYINPPIYLYDDWHKLPTTCVRVFVCVYVWMCACVCVCPNLLGCSICTKDLFFTPNLWQGCTW